MKLIRAVCINKRKDKKMQGRRINLFKYSNSTVYVCVWVGGFEERYQETNYSERILLYQKDVSEC